MTTSITFLPLDLNNIKLALQNDAQLLRTFVGQLEQRKYAYNNLTVDDMVAAGITDSNVQQKILAFIADINRTYDYMTGNVQGVAGDVRVDCAGITGVL